MKSYRACTRYSSGIISLSLMSCERDTEAVWWYSTSSFNELNFTTQRKNLPAKKKKKKTFSNFSCRFLNPKKISILNYNYSIFLDQKTFRNKLKKHSVNKNCFDLSMLEHIVLVISKILQILGLQPRISKVFLDS